MSELKPCPFCGYDDMEDCVQAVPSVWMFTCRKCKMQMIMSADSAGAARKKYNTRAPQWQPIETAPKDGMYVMLFGGGIPAVGSWNGRYWDDGNFDLIPRSGMTHWMPLPAPPEVES